MTVQFNPESLSWRLKTVKPSPTIAITRLAAELRRSGKDIIALSQGEPDFDTPDHIKEAAKKAVDDGLTKYTDVDGTPELKRAIIQNSRTRTHWNSIRQYLGWHRWEAGHIEPFSATLDEGDEVVIPAPYWVSYPDMVLLTGGVPATVACGEDSGFELAARALEDAVTARTKWLIPNSSSDPTGAGYTASELGDR